MLAACKLSLCLVAAVFLELLGPSSAKAQSVRQHPRLFVTQERLQEVRWAVQQPGSTHKKAFQAMKARVRQKDWRVYDANLEDNNDNYARSWLAREAAFMYLLTEKQRYAEIAYEMLEMVHKQPDKDNRLPESGYGLSRAMVGMGFALAYDWAYKGWTPAQRQYVRSKIETALDAWPSYSHANIETRHMGSNWVAVCYGGELVMMLAAYAEENRPKRYHFLKQALHQHMKTAYGPSGWSQEGVGYTSYAGQFLLPAVYALQSVNDQALNKEFQKKHWYRLAMAVGSFANDRLTLMSGVDHSSALGNQGWVSLLFNTVPADQKPYYRYFYDRYMGIKHSLPPVQKYDPERAGTVWALIYYPEDIKAQKPARGTKQTLFDRKKGAYYFRSRWKDKDNILVSVMGDFHHHGNAWDTPEAFQLGLIAHGTRFIGGPAKTGTGSKAGANGFSMLLVDGKVKNGKGRTGAPVRAQKGDNGGGYVVIDGGEKYADLGLEKARRHVRVAFADDGQQALLSTLDKLRSNQTHTYTWQINPGSEENSGGVTMSRSYEDNVPVVTLRGKNDSFLKAWVMSPAAVEITTGDPLQIQLKAADANIWIVLLTGKGKPPVGKVEGKGLQGRLTVEGQVVWYDRKEERIEIKR